MASSAIDTSVCLCDKGSAPSLLVAAVANGVRVTGRTVATISDKSFYAPFGVCSVTGSPCVFAPAASWTNLQPSVCFSGSPCLAQGATLGCAKGGTIQIVATLQGVLEFGALNAFLSALAANSKSPESAGSSLGDIARSLVASAAKEGSLLGLKKKFDLVASEIDKLPDTPENAKVRRYVGKGSRVLSRGVPVVGTALDAHAIATAEDGEARERAIGGAVGGAAGGAAGAAIGGPVGAAVGGAVGSVVGEEVAPHVVDVAETIGGWFD